MALITKRRRCITSPPQNESIFRKFILHTSRATSCATIVWAPTTLWRTKGNNLNWRSWLLVELCPVVGWVPSLQCLTAQMDVMAIGNLMEGVTLEFKNKIFAFELKRIAGGRCVLKPWNEMLEFRMRTYKCWDVKVWGYSFYVMLVSIYNYYLN